MPGMDGVEFLRELRATHRHIVEKSAIVGLSGLFQESPLLDEMKGLVTRMAEKPSGIDAVLALARESLH